MIMNHEWKILKKKKNDMEEYGVGTVGLTHFPNREIWFIDNVEDEVLEQVVFHEVVHAFLNEFGLGHVNSFDNEFICDFISNNYKEIIRVGDIIKNLIK